MTNYATYTEMQNSMAKVNDELIGALGDLANLMAAETVDESEDKHENLFRKFIKKISKKNERR